LRIGDVGSVEIEAIEGQQGDDVTVTGHPLCIAPGYPAVAARSTQLSYHDHSQDWEGRRRHGHGRGELHRGQPGERGDSDEARHHRGPIGAVHDRRMRRGAHGW